MALSKSLTQAPALALSSSLTPVEAIFLTKGSACELVEPNDAPSLVNVARGRCSGRGKAIVSAQNILLFRGKDGQCLPCLRRSEIKVGAWSVLRRGTTVGPFDGNIKTGQPQL